LERFVGWRNERSNSKLSLNSSGGEKECKLKNGFRVWSNPAAILLAMTTQDVALRAKREAARADGGLEFAIEELAI